MNEIIEKILSSLFFVLFFFCRFEKADLICNQSKEMRRRLVDTVVYLFFCPSLMSSPDSHRRRTRQYAETEIIQKTPNTGKGKRKPIKKYNLGRGVENFC
jgi:hypothetical protein